MRRPRRVRENLEEMLEDIRPRFGVSAYPRQLLYDVFQAVKSYLLKLYLGDEVTPPAGELPFKVLNAFSYVSPGFFTCLLLVKRASSAFLDSQEGVQKFHQWNAVRIDGLSLMVSLIITSLAFALSQKDFSKNYFLLVLSSLPVFLGGLLEDLTKKNWS